MTGILTPSITRVRDRVPAGFIEVSGDVLDIARRIRDGDESGWRGDPSMSLTYNPASREFEVLATDRAGNRYVAVSSPRCDHSILIKLREGDPRRGSVVDRVLAHNEKVRADREQQQRDERRELSLRLAHAVVKDIGHLEGGTRPTQSMYDGRKGRR